MLLTVHRGGALSVIMFLVCYGVPTFRVVNYIKIIASENSLFGCMFFNDRICVFLSRTI